MNPVVLSHPLTGKALLVLLSPWMLGSIAFGLTYGRLSVEHQQQRKHLKQQSAEFKRLTQAQQKIMMQIETLANTPPPVASVELPKSPGTRHNLPTSDTKSSFLQRILSANLTLRKEASQLETKPEGNVI